MAEITFITGNEHKAEVFEKFMQLPIECKKLDLDEIQSLNLKEVAEHKLKQAHEILKSPVLVEDSGCSMDAFGKFPGPLVKWLMQEISLEDICRLVDGRIRGAVAEVCYGYFDGREMKFFEGSVHGAITDHPRGNSEFGWNAIFVPDGDQQTYAESGKNFREVTVYPELKQFLSNLDKMS